jgi:indolepyruvate ferredoxin oxidoreductase beta subunit
MEAARAIERGFVTPDRTRLIASTHRVYAMTEKIALADGRADTAALLGACREAARALVAFDMAGIAEATGSVISAVLFGALAGSGALPFSRTAFEAAIRRGKVGVNASLAAFGAGFAAAQDGETTLPDATAERPPPPAALRALLTEVARDYAGEALPVVSAAIERLVDYQDEDYARSFLTRLAPIRDIDARHGDGTHRLTAETARTLALAMSYEDTIRVAELKIRAQRFARVRQEAQVADGQILEIAEFLHPRTQEIADTLPAPLGRWLLRTGWARRLTDRLTRKGRVVKTTSLRGFLLLYALAGRKRHRRRTLRFAAEQAGIERWLALVAETARADYALAVGVARLRGLVKGYGDTHARAAGKFERIVAVLPQLRRQPNPAAALDALIKAALAEEGSLALERAIAALGAPQPAAAAVS